MGLTTQKLIIKTFLFSRLNIRQTGKIFSIAMLRLLSKCSGTFNILNEIPGTLLHNLLRLLLIFLWYFPIYTDFQKNNFFFCSKHSSKCIFFRDLDSPVVEIWNMTFESPTLQLNANRFVLHYKWSLKLMTYALDTKRQKVHFKNGTTYKLLNALKSHQNLFRTGDIRVQFHCPRRLKHWSSKISNCSLVISSVQYQIQTNRFVIPLMVNFPENRKIRRYLAEFSGSPKIKKNIWLPFRRQNTLKLKFSWNPISPPTCGFKSTKESPILQSKMPSLENLASSVKIIFCENFFYILWIRTVLSNSISKIVQDPLETIIIQV